MAYKSDNILGKKVVIVGMSTREVNSLEQVLLYAGADVLSFTNVTKAKLEIPSSQAHIIVFDDTEIAEPLEFVREINHNTPGQNPAWLIIHNSFNPEQYLTEKTLKDTYYLTKAKYDAAEVLKGLSTIMKQAPRTEVKEEITIPTAAVELRAPMEVKVLIFEDDPLLQNILTIHLNRAKVNFKIAETGLNFKSQILSFKPTVILLDLTLDGLNGLNVLQAIRQDPNISSLPVVIFTNSADDNIKAQTTNLGVKDFLIKANTNFADLVTLLVQRSAQKKVNNP